MATVGIPRVNKPTDIKLKEEDVNRKLQLYGIFNAFQQGKVPSNDQIDVALNSFLATKAIASPSQKLSPEGRVLVKDFRDVVEKAKHLILSKNQGNLLQDFIWQAQQFDRKNVSVSGAPVDKESAKQHGQQALDGLKTLGKLLITNGQFRKLLKDATILLRDMAGDAASDIASRVKPSPEILAQIDTPAQDNTWHDAPDFSKNSMKKQFQKVYKGDAKEDVNDVLNKGQAASSQGRNGGSSGSTAAAARTGLGASLSQAARHVDEKLDPEAKEKARKKRDEYRARTKEYLNKKMPQERRDQTIWRLKKMILECQQHKDYQQAIQTLLDLADQYGSHAQTMVKGGSGSVREARSGLSQAERDLKTLIERFANGTSTDNLWSSIDTVRKDADKDPELKTWFKSLNKYVRRCFQEQGYVLDEESNDDWNRLYDSGKRLLRGRYRSHVDNILDEVKFLADQFDKDAQNKAFAGSLTKLFKHLGQNESGKPAFKPHLIKDLTETIVPAIFENIAYIPIPRIEYSDPQIDLIVENLVLEGDNLYPNLFEITNHNYVKLGRKTFTNKNDHMIDIKVAGIQVDLRDVSYYVKRKRGFPSITDKGVANILLPGEGFSFRMKLSSAHKTDKQNFFKVDKVDVDMKHLQIKLVKSRHKLLFSLVKPMLLKLMRPVLQKVAEKAIKDKFNEYDRYLYQIKKEADRARIEAADPKKAPNVYSRYASAMQQRMKKDKEEKAKKVKKATEDKKMNVAITKEDSIFPSIALPGGISTKATEYRELARKGDKWESPVFSIGSAAKSHDIPMGTDVRVKNRPVAGTNGVSRKQGRDNGTINIMGTPATVGVPSSVRV